MLMYKKAAIINYFMSYPAGPCYNLVRVEPYPITLGMFDRHLIVIKRACWALPEVCAHCSMDCPSSH